MRRKKQDDRRLIFQVCPVDFAENDADIGAALVDRAFKRGEDVDRVDRSGPVPDADDDRRFFMIKLHPDFGFQLFQRRVRRVSDLEFRRVK